MTSAFAAICITSLLFTSSAFAKTRSEEQKFRSGVKVEDHAKPYWADDKYPRLGKINCAPEVIEGNVNATSRTLSSLLQTDDFNSASLFRKQVAQISNETVIGKKAQLFLALVGVDAQDSEAVVEFVGARDVKASWLMSLERNSDLTRSQATIVAAKLQTELRGSLK
ncbi:MAG: hypothetical protein EOP06_21925 [Proteobacteria bacterium]|nr:MAG: hypothetical protein EOP06_21925 [Pseudomonadota bacterium]